MTPSHPRNFIQNLLVEVPNSPARRRTCNDARLVRQIVPVPPALPHYFPPPSPHSEPWITCDPQGENIRKQEMERKFDLERLTQYPMRTTKRVGEMQTKLKSLYDDAISGAHVRKFLMGWRRQVPIETLRPHWKTSRVQEQETTPDFQLRKRCSVMCGSWIEPQS